MESTPSTGAPHDAEEAYEEGERAVWMMLLRQAVQHLGLEALPQGWTIERLDTLQILRQMCARYGDNDWDDTLHLGDVLEKHLWKHLEIQGWR